MAQDNEDHKIGLSPAQVAGSALAAVSGAMLASFAGTTGTIIGTAVGSIVATVGAAIYTWSLRRTSAAVRRTAAQVRQTALLTGPLPRTVRDGPLRAGGKRGKDAGSTEDGPVADQQATLAEAQRAVDEAAAEEEESVRKALPWGKLALTSIAVSVLALVGITTFEAVTGQPISSLLGGDDAKGTTVGNVVHSDNKSSTDNKPTNKDTPAPEESQTPAPDDGSTTAPDVPEPSVTPTTPTPSDLPSDGASTAPQGGPTADPSTAP
jgi:hypothetical protein